MNDHWKDCPCPECRRARGRRGLQWLVGAACLLVFILAIIVAAGCPP